MTVKEQFQLLKVDEQIVSYELFKKKRRCKMNAKIHKWLNEPTTKYIVLAIWGVLGFVLGIIGYYQNWLGPYN